jgi:transcriptional regulator with XRE-family HTH domain
MPLHTDAVGETLRRLRTERELSLASVAEKAQISVATLSRVETNKQTIDVHLLVTLARILEVPAGEILGDDGDTNDVDAVSRKLAQLAPADRTRAYLQAARRRSAKEVSSTLDDLLSTVDLLRDELLSVQRAVGGSRRKR